MKKKIPRRNDDGKLRVFVLESPNPLDWLQERSEAPILQQVCRLFGHEVGVMPIRSVRQFKEACQYISTIDPKLDTTGMRRRTLCIHISAHGNKNGLAFGQDEQMWSDLLVSLEPIFQSSSEYKGDRILVLSACFANRQTMTKSFEKMAAKGFQVPVYLFLTKGGVSWEDAVAMWTLFYYLMPTLQLHKKSSVQGALKKINSIGAGRIGYARWDKNKKQYLRFLV